MSFEGSHHVAVLALPGVRPLDLGIPAQVFTPRPGSPYSLTLCAQGPGPVPTNAGFDVVATAGLEGLAAADTVIVPAYEDVLTPPPEPVLDALRAAHRSGRRVVSICTGAFALAAAGLLDGRRATTHWNRAAALAENYPDVDVDDDALYVDEGQVLTSAGVSAGIDLCLHLVRRDLGAAAAAAAARTLVAAPHRDGGQRQFLLAPVAAVPGTSLGEVRDRAVAELERPLTVADLADWAHVSPRTFARRFLAETGVTPKQWLLAVRVQRARELLETGDLPVERVAAATGLGTPANFRVHFHRVTGRSPAAYRASFNPGPVSR